MSTSGGGALSSSRSYSGGSGRAGTLARWLQADLADVLSLADFDRVAKSYLPRMVYGYIDGAVETGAGKSAAARAYEQWAFVPQTLNDVSCRQQERTLLGRRYAAPFGIPPLGGAAIAAYRGDLVLARAASAANLPMVMSASSLIRLEEVRAAYPTAWFQAYLAGDPVRITAMLDRVEAAGFETLVITVDTPVPGNRENNIRSGYSMPIKVTSKVALDCISHPRWLVGTLGQTFWRHGMPYFENMDAVRGPPMMSRDLQRNLGDRDQLNWSHMEGIRKRWKGHLVIKGLLSAADAARAKALGADAIVVSNHGGRQLDHAVAPLQVLPGIKAAVGDLPVIIDGGIRRGTDILKALALGAEFVFVGRPFLYAAAIAGENGVQHAVHLLREEISRNMAMLGIAALDALDRDHLCKTDAAIS